MKCLLITDGLMYRSGRNRWYTKNTFVEFARALAAHFSRLTLFVPVRTVGPGRQPDGLFEIRTSQRFRIHGAGSFAGVAGFYLEAPLRLTRIRACLERLLDGHDVVLMRLPSMNAFFLSRAVLKRGMPFCTYVVGDQEVIVTRGGKYTGLLKLLVGRVAQFHSRKIRRLNALSSASVFLGRSLFQKYGQDSRLAVNMFTSLVRTRDIRLRRLAPWPPAVPTLLFAGRLEHEKGVMTLLRAAVILKRTGLRFRVRICGTGSARGLLESCSKKLGLDREVSFLGFVPLHPDLDRLLAGADLFILPSLSEGVPKVILEAMAKGTPVIASDAGGIPEIVTHGKTGVLVPPGDEHCLADAVRHLLDHGDLVRAVQRNAYDLVREKTLENQADRLARIIHRSAGKEAL